MTITFDTGIRSSRMLQANHALLPDVLRKIFTTELFPGTRTVCKGKLLPEFERKHGRKPESQCEVADLMESSFIEAGLDNKKFFCGSREPVYLKGQLPPISLVGAIKE